MDIDDRPSALLTDRQRKYLCDELDISQSGERAARRRIRERLQASVFDMSLIMRELSLDDVDKAFTDPDPEAPRASISDTLPDLIALLYLADRESETIDNESTHDGWRMEDKVETGIKRALTHRLEAKVESVTADIIVERGDSLESLAEGDLAALSTDELTQLVMAGQIDSDEFAQAITAKQE